MAPARAATLGLVFLWFAACADRPPAARATGARASGQSEELVGLWKAVRRFGPFAGARLAVRRVGGSQVAEMLGRTAPVRAADGRLSFELGGLGRFRGAARDAALLGHWVPPASVAHGLQYTSPVRLEPDGPDGWRGQVVPFEDVFTLYLAVRKRTDGSVGAFLRNPERNWGFQLGVERIERDGSSVVLFGRRADEEREVASGTYDDGRGRLVLTMPGRGSIYEFRRERDDSNFYPRGANPGRYAYRPPPARGDGWPTGTLEEAGIDRAAIERFVQKIVDMPMESAETPEIHAVLIARGGKLVFEEYFHGEHRDKPHDTRSAAKSLTALLAGAAMEAGEPIRLSTPVYRTMFGREPPADLDPRKRAMNLEHLLTMSSGHFCDDTDPAAPGNEEVLQEQTAEPDWYRYTLAVPMASAPGEKAVYCSCDPNLALGLLARATGTSALDLFDRLLAGPMSIRRYAWPLDRAGQPYGGGGVYLLPRDFLKLGQLMLNGGTWQGRRLLGRDFASRASAPLYHLRGITYGYLWWGIDLPYKQRTVRAFFAGGNGGQGAMVIPELDLAIATLAGNYGSRTGLHIQQELPAIHILPAVREPGDDPDATAPPREEFRTPYDRGARRSGPIGQPR